MLDWTLIIVAVCAGGSSILGAWLGVRQSNKVTNLRLDNLETKMDKHNNLVERIYRSENCIVNMQGDIARIEKKIGL